MTERETTGGQLCGVQRRLSRWREQHGGRGRPIRSELWTAAVEVAAIEGVNATARALGVDRARLARRVERSVCAAVAPSEQTRALPSSTAV